MNDESSNAWAILDRESGMLERSIQERSRLGHSIHDEERLQVLNNALSESAILHARNLCELFAEPEGKFARDMSLSHLLPDWDWAITKYERLNALLSELEDKYGQYLDVKSPSWTFNQILAHVTLKRLPEKDYTAALDTVLPVLRQILVEIQSKRHD